MTPIPVKTPQKGHEASSLRSPRDSDSLNRQWQKGNRSLAQEQANLNAVRALEMKVEKMRRRILGGGQSAIEGWFWIQDQRVFDETLAYKKNQIVYIPASHTIVTTGFDNDGTQVYAIAGLWVATQDTDGTTATLPTWPYPVADNPDSTGNYWWLISAAQVCT